MFAVFAFFCFALAFFYYLHNRGRRRERIFNLILLRRELSHYQFAATNPDDAKRLSRLIAGVDSLLKQFGASTGPYEGNRRRNAAWRLVCRHLGYSTNSHPPWAAQNGRDESTAGGLPPEVAATAKPASQPAAEESTVLVVTSEPAELTAADPAQTPPSPSDAETGADDSPEPEDEFELPSLSELNRRLARVEAEEEDPEADQIPAEAGAGDSATGAEAPEATAKASAASSRQRDEEKNGARDSTPAKDDAAEAAAFAWQPVEPDRTQRFIKIVTGASGLFVGFLTQNIGWFIGGFSFLAGAVFLTAISGGILRILLVTGFLSIYAVFFLWGAWQIRRHRPAVSGASTILAVISVLLMPLCIAASVRVYADSGYDLQVTGGGVLVTLLLIVFCAYGSRLGVGIADRSLSGGIPRRFWVLAAVQGTAPFVAYVPHPGGLIGLHLLLLILLAEGVIRFLRSWMTAVFRNHPISAYLAAGLLVYAALVSFLHVTLRYPRPLPAGYFGPFLMLLSGLLVYVDQEIRQRFQRYMIPSRFGIIVFGVSTAALVLSQPAPPARIITYFAGIWIYGAAVWSYLSLPSMLFFLICASGLYAQFILAPLPSSLYFLASIPGLSVLFGVHLWAGRKKAHRLSRLTFRILFMLAAGLAAWSLVHAEPGVTGLASAFVLTLTIYGILRYAAGYVFESLGFFRASGSADLTDGYLCYAVSLAALTVIAYFPDIPGVNRWTLSAVGLTLFALTFALWGCFSGRGVYGRKEVLTNSALLYALASMAAVVASDPRLFTDYRLFTETQVLISTGGAAATWLLVGYHLRIRFVVSIGLFFGGFFGFWAKRALFPGPSVGLAEISACYAGLFFLRRLRLKARCKGLVAEDQNAEEEPAAHPPFHCLFVFPAFSRSRFHALYHPLSAAVVLLLAAAVFRSTVYILFAGVDPPWLGASVFIAAACIPSAVHFRFPAFIDTAVYGGFCIIAAGVRAYTDLDRYALWFAATLYATAVWAAALGWRKYRARNPRPPLPSLAEAFSVRREAAVRRAGYVVTTAALVLASVDWALQPVPPVMPVFLGCALFYLLTDIFHREPDRVVEALFSITGVFFALFVSTAGHDDLMDLAADFRGAVVFAGVSLTAAATAAGLRIATKNAAVSSSNRSPVLRGYIRSLRIWGLFLAAAGAVQLLYNVYGAGTPPEPVAVFALALSGVAVLASAHHLENAVLYFIGFACLGVAIFWGEGVILHPGAISHFRPPEMPDDRRLTLLATGFLFASASRGFIRSRRFAGYTEPLRAAALLYAGWGAWGILPAFLEIFIHTVHDGFDPWLFGLLALTVFPLTAGMDAADQIRGFLLPVFLTGLFGCLALHLPLSPGAAFTAWGFLMWGIAELYPPLAAARFPSGSVSTRGWCLAGLAFVLFAFPLFQGIQSVRLPAYPFLISLYLFLLLRHVRWKDLPYLATGALALAGLTALVEPVGRDAEIYATNAVLSLAFANVFAFGASLWGRIGRKIRWWFADPQVDLTGPFLCWPYVIACFWTAAQAIGAYPFPADLMPPPSLPFWVGGFTAATMAHLYIHRQSRLTAHLLLAPLVILLFSFRMSVSGPYFQFPLLLMLWVLAAFGAHVWMIDRFKRLRNSPMAGALYDWSRFGLFLVIPLLLLVPVVYFPETLLVMALWSAAAGLMGWRLRMMTFIWPARIMGVVFLLVWPSVFLPPAETTGLVLLHIGPVLAAKFDRVKVLFPFLALELSLVSLLLYYFRRFIAGAVNRRIPGAEIDAEVLPAELWPALMIWLVHLGLFLGSPYGPQMDSPAAAGAVSAFAGITTGILLHQSCRRESDLGCYGSFLVVMIAGIYLRVLFWGRVPPMPADAAVLTLAAFVTAAAAGMMRSHFLQRPLARTAMVIPPAAVFMVPLAFGSRPASAVLLAASALYFLLFYTADRRWAIVPALICINLACYLWIPVWSADYRLVHVYAVPAAMSALVLVHLNRREMPGSVVSGTRLAAVSVLYATAALDFFPRDDLVRFAGALALGSVGIAAGIGFRVRAFLYGGVVFFVLNVAGQLLLFYSRQTVGKGVLLVVFGTVVMGIMVLFSIHREAILRRYRFIKTEMDSWE